MQFFNCSKSVDFMYLNCSSFKTLTLFGDEVHTILNLLFFNVKFPHVLEYVTCSHKFECRDSCNSTLQIHHNER